MRNNVPQKLTTMLRSNGIRMRQPNHPALQAGRVVVCPFLVLGRLVKKSLRYLLPGKYKGTNRALYYSMALLIFLTAITPAVQMFVDHTVYNLDSKADALVGEPNVNLARKFSYNPGTKTYVFNEKQKVSEDSELPVEVQLMQHKLGGGGKDDKTLYSVDLPDDLTKGMTYYDNNLGLSFKLVPKFTTGKGKLEQNRLVYVNPDGGPKLVFTAMANGLKEDIVYDEAPLTPDQSWQYELKLPDTLVARTMSDGGVGIYSADASLFKDVSLSEGMDEEKLKSARMTGEKTNLVFAIPAPFIKQSGNAQGGNAQASFVLSQNGRYLTVDATGLDDKLTYPLTVDPSVVITSTSDFKTGNNEGNIDYPTDQITGGTLTGGSITGSWTASTSFTSGRSDGATVAYNGYVYMIGGTDRNTSTFYATVQYAPINSNGTLGTWNATTSMPDARAYHAAVTYNGYLYVLGGQDDLYQYPPIYARINSNGTIGSWATTNSYTTSRSRLAAVTYNGYIYILGGWSGAYQADVQYTRVNADGTLNTWSTGSTFATGRYGLKAVAYNGRLYITGGYNGTHLADVQQALINAGGSLSPWGTTTAFTTGRYGHTAVEYNGYLYIIGGWDGTAHRNDVQYAPIYAMGTIGPWTTTTAFTTARSSHMSIAHNGYLYVMGGDNTTTYYATTQYARIASPGVTTSYSTTSSFTTAREHHASVAYRGYMYVVGGEDSAGNELTSIQYAAINEAGTLGAWAATTALPVAIRQHTAVAYNGKLYVVGGWMGTARVNSVRRVDINANGTLGATWTTTTYTTTISEHTSVAYNGYLYVIGGFVDGGPTYVANVRYASIDPATGNLGVWTDTTAINGARHGHTHVVYNGRMYVLGGYNGVVELADVQYNTINTNGTLGVSWTNTTSFDDSRNDHTTIVYNGYIYVMAGHVGANLVATVQYAQLNTDGSVGTWAYTTSLPVDLDDHTSVEYNGFFYAIGGTVPVNTHQTSVYYAQLNNNESGTTGTWSATTSIAGARYGHTSVAYRDTIYAIGGFTTVNETSVVRGTVPYNGVTLWAGATALPAGRTYHSSVVYNGYLYVIGGGDNASARYDTVYYAALESNGAIAPSGWQTTTAFSGAGPARHRHTSVAYNGYLYVIGGSNGTTYYNSVLYAPINANGTLGSWATTTGFTSSRHRHASVVYNGYVYVLGGTNETVFYRDVQYAPLNANGTITSGAWKYTNAYDVDRHSNPVVASDGYIYTVGGRNGSTGFFDDVEFASINTNGTIGEWKKSSSFTTARQAHSSFVHKGMLYIIGGNGGSNLADVQRARLKVVTRSGQYTKLIDLGHSVLSGISYNGSLPGVFKDIRYMVADDSGVFGATRYESDQLPASIPLSCEASANNPTRYVFLTVTLDESSRAGFPDSLASKSNVTDITVLSDPLRAPTNMRLMHGKWFKEQVQQPLDTCAT